MTVHGDLIAFPIFLIIRNHIRHPVDTNSTVLQRCGHLPDQLLVGIRIPQQMVKFSAGISGYGDIPGLADDSDIEANRLFVDRRPCTKNVAKGKPFSVQIPSPRRLDRLFGRQLKRILNISILTLRLPEWS